MQCKMCDEEVDELYPVKVEGKRRKVCEECVERLQEEGVLADEALDAVRQMMGYKGTF